MRLATVVTEGGLRLAVVRGDRFLALPATPDGPSSMRLLAASGQAGLDRVRAVADGAAAVEWRPLDEAVLGPAVPDPGAIYAIGLNYRDVATAGDGAEAVAPVERDAPSRPLVYAKLPGSVAGDGATLSWDRSLTANVDAECELGVVVGEPADRVPVTEAADHVFAYTCINDVSSRDPWLDGDQWLLGKSMAGFCPVGPWVVTGDSLDPTDIAIGCRLNGQSIQDGRTSAMRRSVAELIAFLSRHVVLHPGDLIATGTPARLVTPPGPSRHLEPGDVVTAWIDGIGELTTRVA